MPFPHPSLGLCVFLSFRGAHRSSKILLVQVGTLSSSHPSFGVSVFFLSFFVGGGVADEADESDATEETNE